VNSCFREYKNHIILQRNATTMLVIAKTDSIHNFLISCDGTCISKISVNSCV
jgi:hypothetical protein